MLFYPLTIRYLDNNQLTNIMPNLEATITMQITGTKLYYKDNKRCLVQIRL